MKSFKLKTAGHTKDLYVYSVTSFCGDIKDGIGVRFVDRSTGRPEGVWVIDVDSLRRVIEKYDEYHGQP